MVDPRKWKKEQLLAHATTVLNGHIRQVAEPDMTVIMTQYNRESADDELVAALLASVSSLPSGSASGDGRAPRRQEHKAAVDDDRAEGEEVGSDQPGSADEQRAGGDGEGEGGEVNEGGEAEVEDELDEGGEGAGGRQADGDCQEVWDDEGGRSLHRQQAHDKAAPPSRHSA